MTLLHDSRPLLEALYRGALHAIHPARAVHDALDTGTLDPRRPVHLIAVGKAARTMAAAAAEWCAQHGVRLAGGACISHESDATPIANLMLLQGDHPAAGDASAAAADALHALIRQQVRRDDQVLVLLSGGASALIGAPVESLDAATYRAACAALLRSGLDIHAHNALRRQLSMWGNGRLGAALHAVGATAIALVVSDVPGDVLASIGSAPCLTTSASAEENATALQTTALAAGDVAVLREALHAAAAVPAVPFPAIPHLVISSNRVARRAVCDAAEALGVPAQKVQEALSGDAHRLGAQIAQELISAAAGGARTALWCWGGEPVLAVPADAPPGGRMQALALAAARTLHEAGDAARGITLLAAGTDGRDGNTDAAGACVTADTWRAVTEAAVDAADCLRRFDSHSALRAAQALLPAFASGTNVSDLVIGIVRR